MLHGRVAPPSSPAVTVAASMPPRPVPVARRNSFSRDVAASIAQTRAPLGEGIELHLNDAFRPLSPRKVASFSLPRAPQEGDVDLARVLRPTLSDVQLRRLVDNVPLADNHKDLAIEVPTEAADALSSASSSSYSPVSPTRGGDDGDDGDDEDSDPAVDDPDAFETWLHEARVLESPTHETRPPQTTTDALAWLRHDRAPSLELSKSVQQIEHEIRLAIDSAASRVADETERRESLVQDLAAAKSDPAVTPSEPELLLLMDVLIGDGRSETIEVHVGDRPQDLATVFAAKHGLVADAIPRLTQHIQDQLDALEDEEEENDEPQPVTPAVYENEGAVDCNGNDLDCPDDTLDDVVPERQQREYEREHKYNHLMEKYGHYASHSNKVDPTAAAPRPSTRLSLHHDDAGESDPLTQRNLEFSEHARLKFTPRPVATSSSQPTSSGRDKDSVYNRLYALAEAREKWLRRQQKAKAADEVRERQAMSKLEISAKSRDMVATRGSGGYAHIGERLYDEALNDLAKKARAREKRERERATQVDWTCPKCAFVNQHDDVVCQNVVASVVAPPPAPTLTLTSRLSVAALVDAHPEVVCGYARPDELFRPTLLVAPATVTRAVQHHKVRATATAASSQRQRTQQQMEDEFRQTCPFKPTINDMSEEIMRDKLAQESKAGVGAGVVTTATGDVRRKNPHIALYEDAFHARAQREAREEAHLKQFPFKPNIGVNALWQAKRAGEDADVVERLAVSTYRELERKRESLYAKYAPDRDPTTGREYFKPETGRAPIFNRNERGLPIGDFLYEAHKEQEEYLRRLRQEEDDRRKQSREQGFVSDKSKQALATRKKKTCAGLFDVLVQAQQPRPAADDDKRTIVPSALDISTLPPEIARIASIVAEFAHHEPFTFDDFEGFVDKLMNEVPGLTYTQVLFVTDKLQDSKSRRTASDHDDGADDPELTFRPAIDRNSDALAKKHGRGDRPNVFEALNQYYEHYKDRQTQAKKQREREFARTHPFQPMFYTKDRTAKATKFYDKLDRQDLTTMSLTSIASQDATPLLRTAVPNARPFVRPLGRTPSDQTLRSRASSAAGGGDDDDAALTSHVLAALDDSTSLVSSPVSAAEPPTAQPVVLSSTPFAPTPVVSSVAPPVTQPAVATATVALANEKDKQPPASAFSALFASPSPTPTASATTAATTTAEAAPPVASPPSSPEPSPNRHGSALSLADLAHYFKK